jgi:hypothetical protein
LVDHARDPVLHVGGFFVYELEQPDLEIPVAVPAQRRERGSLSWCSPIGE